MDKLNNDELILIMLSMKKQYEKKYDTLDRKYRALAYMTERHCDSRLLIHMDCTVCQGICYLGEIDTQQANAQHTDTIDNFVTCSGCAKVACEDCFTALSVCSMQHAKKAAAAKDAACEHQTAKKEEPRSGYLGFYREDIKPVGSGCKYWCNDCYCFNMKMKNLK
tara:strand:- start:946 stop:1440 length:495 start_codon:yes stop_codon:yes gene_type:complete